MSGTTWLYPLATLLTAVGLWLLLPRGWAGGRAAGAVLTAVALGMWAAHWPPLGNWMAAGEFDLLALVTLVAAVGTVTSRSPVYCALWFGLALVGTAGLLLVIGAEFLAVATLIVYAGAILVTFLFLLMMARPARKTLYDHRSWEALMSAATSAVIAGLLSMAISSAVLPPKDRPRPISPPTAAALAEGVLAPDQVAQLGSLLFSRHLIAVEVAGTVLLAAMVGAAMIANHTKEKNKSYPRQ